MILEIGLGGRLDAINTIDSNAAVISTIGIDHVAFLGNTREAIGLEKPTFTVRAAPPSAPTPTCPPR